MADAPRPPVPSRSALDRTALERVLSRAAELQTAGELPSAAEQLTDEQIVALGKEVGLSPEHLRQALAEERTRSLALPEHGGPVARSLGDGVVSASRTVSGTPADVLAGLDGHMRREQCLQPKRTMPERIVWEARADVFTAIRRAFDIAGRGFPLARAHEVSATAIAVESGRVHVRLDADLTALKWMIARRTAAGGTVGAVGVTGAVLVNAALVPFVAVPALLIAGGAFWSARRTYLQTLTRAHLALEQALDRLERGEFARSAAPRLLDTLAQAAAQAAAHAQAAIEAQSQKRRM